MAPLVSSCTSLCVPSATHEAIIGSERVVPAGARFLCLSEEKRKTAISRGVATIDDITPRRTLEPPSPLHRSASRERRPWRLLPPPGRRSTYGCHHIVRGSKFPNKFKNNRRCAQDIVKSDQKDGGNRGHSSFPCGR